MKTKIVILMFLPLVALSQSPYFTAFGQLTIPTGNFAQESQNYDAFVKTGYGGGADLHVHLNESLMWMTTLAFSSNKLDDHLKLNSTPIEIKSDYSFYNLPVLTGLQYEITIEPIRIGAWGQLGINYAEFPSISGTIPDESSLQNNFDSIIDGKTKFGVSVGLKAVFNKGVLAIRYMHFGDYTFKGTYNTSTSALEQPLQFDMSVSFFMLSLGYNLDFSGDE